MPPKKSMPPQKKSHHQTAVFYVITAKIKLKFNTCKKFWNDKNMHLNMMYSKIISLM